MDEKLYEDLGDKSEINIWISTRQSQIRGLIYPFIYSIKEVSLTKPDDYSKNEVLTILDKYDYNNIPESQKVNYISIMLEAYNDFSKFEELNIDDSVYKDLHKIESKAISGNLVTSIFGGGTIETERNFLTGYKQLSNFRKETDSFVWYFKDQGYHTEGFHPVEGSFYNRRTVNSNLGFDNYFFYEEQFSNYSGWNGYASDSELFEGIIEGYEKQKGKNTPYFSFSVTYQNHGPYYEENYIGEDFHFSNPGISEKSYNIVNNYLDGIKNTNEELHKLINYIENQTDPIIFIMFGDHNPYLADAYDELYINMDISTVEGFENYYETLYVIYANDAAKKVFDKSFVKKGETISPIFIIPELFEYIGLEGNEFMQYLIELKSHYNVISPYYYNNHNGFVEADDNDLVKKYKWINYYLLKKTKSK